MEVRTLTSAVMKVLFLLAAQDEVCCLMKDDDAIPQVVPNKQQFFDYEPIIVSCEGLMGVTGWRVLKKIKGEIKPCAGTWESSTGSCKIKNAMHSIDTGEYWCELGAKRINSVNLTITDGPVILESPVLPVTEGDNVTLSCRNKESSPNITVQFFKDGISMGTSHTGTMTIYSVSRSHEGLYKCIIAGEGGSPQSWLTVREPQEDPTFFILNSQRLWICVGVCIFLVVLLLLVWILRHKKHPTIPTEEAPPSVQSPPPAQRVSAKARANDPMETTYSLVDKPKKKAAPKETYFDDSSMQTTYSFIDKPETNIAMEAAYLDNPMHSTYALVNKPVKKRGPELTRSSTGPGPSAVMFTGY